jgi:hypothetical protein
MTNDLQFSPSLLWMTPFIPNQTGMLLATLKPFPSTILQIPPPVIPGGGNYAHNLELLEQPEPETQSEIPDIVIEPEVSKTVDNLSVIIEDILEAEELVDTIESQDPPFEFDDESNDTDNEQNKDALATSTKLVSTDYQCATDDFYVGVNSNNATKITLPLNPKDGTIMIIKAEMQSLHSNKKITIVTADDSVIDGSARYFISKPYGVARLLHRGGNWYSV